MLSAEQILRLSELTQDYVAGFLESQRSKGRFTEQLREEIYECVPNVRNEGEATEVVEATVMVINNIIHALQGGNVVSQDYIVYRLQN